MADQIYPDKLLLNKANSSYTEAPFMDLNVSILNGTSSTKIYHKLRKAFSKFYRRHNDLVSKYNVGLKSLLQQGLSKP